MSQQRMARPFGRYSRVAAVLGLALITGASSPAAQQRDRYTLEGDQVGVFNLAGELRVEPGSGSAVIVEVVRGGKDAGALKVVTEERRGVPTLVVVYPGNRVVYPKIPGRWTSTETFDRGGRSKGLDLVVSRRVTVTGHGSGTEAWADLRVLVPKGKKLILRHVAGRARVEGVEADVSVDHGIGALDVQGVRGDVSLDTGSGEVTVTDVRGDVSVDTGSGPVSLSQIQGGSLALDTGSGGLRASHVQVDDLSADTGSGDVELNDVAAERISLDTGSGDVMLGLASAARDIVVDSGSGSITLRVPQGFGAEFDIESSGSIDVDVEHQALEIDDDHVRGKIGDGRGRVHIDGGSGGVRIAPGGRGGTGRVGMLGTLLTTGVG